MSVFDDRLPARMVLERLASLEAKATPGPWWSEDEPNPYIFAANNASGTVMATRYFATSEDGVLIAAARNVLPALLAVAEAAAKVSHHSDRDGEIHTYGSPWHVGCSLCATLGRIEGER